MTNRFWNYLGRITTSGNYIPEIDGLRFVAIAAVFVHHLEGYLRIKSPFAFTPDPISHFLHRVCSFGNFGVQLFFTISGFILALPFIKNHYEKTAPFNIKQYFQRRLARIEPPYMINLGLCFILLVWVNHADIHALWPNVLASLGYVHNVVYARMSDINCVAWSLEVEVQFYTLVPITLYALYRLTTAYRCLGYTVGYLGVATLQTLHPSPIAWLGTFGQYFLVGILLADCYYRTASCTTSRPITYDGLAFVGWCGLFGILYHDLYVHWFAPLCIFAAYFGVLRGKIFRAIFSWRILTTIGGMCYTIYLYHFLCISFWGRHTSAHWQCHSFWTYFIIQVIFIGAGTLMICTALFLVFEKPFMIKAWPTKLFAYLRSRTVPDRSVTCNNSRT